MLNRQILKGEAGMSIPHESLLSDEDIASLAGFFRTLSIDQETCVGAVFLIDGRGEPLEFTYNRASVKHRRLWRERDLRSAMTRELLLSLLDTCPRDPTVLLCLAREMGPELFAEEIDVQRPVARVAPHGEAIPVSHGEEHERLGTENLQLAWVRERPSDSTAAHRLIGRLASRGLLLEPFERLLVGLREAYALPAPEGEVGAGEEG